MELTKNVFERIAQVDKRHVRFMQIFATFVERVQFLGGPNSTIKGIKLEAAAQENILDVFFAGIRIRFLLLVCYGEDASPRGRVVCSRKIQNLFDTNDIVGSFTFSGQGVTDFDVEQGHESVEMEYHAIDIVLHFVNLAIGKPLPEWSAKYQSPYQQKNVSLGIHE